MAANALSQVKDSFKGIKDKIDNLSHEYPMITLVAMATLGPLALLSMFVGVGGMPHNINSFVTLGGVVNNTQMAMAIGLPIALLGAAVAYGLHKLDKNGTAFKVLRWPGALIIIVAASIATMLLAKELGNQVFSEYARTQPKGPIIPVPPELRFSMLNTVLVISAKGCSGLVERLTDKCPKYRRGIYRVAKLVGILSLIASMSLLTKALVQGTGDAPQMALTRKGVAVTIGAIVVGGAALAVIILESLQASNKARLQYCRDADRSEIRHAQNLEMQNVAANK